MEAEAMGAGRSASAVRERKSGERLSVIERSRERGREREREREGERERERERERDEERKGERKRREEGVGNAQQRTADGGRA